MNILWPVKRETDQKTVVMEKCRPFRIQERSVGLKGIVNRTAAGIFAFKRQGATEEIHTCQQRLASMPFDCKFRKIT
jgi:hypothetical protein